MINPRRGGGTAGRTRIRPATLLAGALGVGLLIAGCTDHGNEPPADVPPPAAVVPSSTVPPSSGIAVTPEQLADADPCDLLDARALSTYGKAEVESESRFTGCAAQVFPETGSLIRLRLGFDFRPTNTTLTPRQRQGVTVYGDTGDETWCRRSIVVAPTAAINLGVAADNGPDACPIADAVVDAMLPKLKQGQLPSAGHPPTSLANLDACALLQHTETNQVPGIDRTQVHPGYAGQHCTWGVETVDAPNVFVSFDRTYPFKVDGADQRLTTVSGRSALVDPFEGGENPQYRTLPNCSVEFVHRSLDPPDGDRTVEVVQVDVSFDGPEQARCDLALDLATRAAGRLPAP